jgi:putative FmdB family regulatory protein
MPVYVYGCPECGRRVEVVHAWGDNPMVTCAFCKVELHRIPQLFTHYNNPAQTLVNMLDDKYRVWRSKKERQRRRKG